MKRLLRYYQAIISSYSEVFFLQDRRYGLILLLISFFNVNIAVSGLIAIITVLLFAAFIRMETDFLENGFYLFNPLLVGMSIGYIFEVTAVSFLLIIMASIFTFLLTMVLYHLFYRVSVPILSLPFTLVSTLIYLATLNYTSLYTQALYVGLELFDLSFLPQSLSMFLKAFSTILFLPYASIGLVFAVLLLSYSRIMFLFALAGFYTGVFVHSLMLGSNQLALLNPYAFNYILISIALGSIFLVPSVRSIVIALSAVAMSVLMMDASSSFWTIYKIPVFTLPFNVITVFFLFVLKSVRLREFAYRIKKTPEMTLRSYVLSVFRFKAEEINLFLPFSGNWSVYQGFDDEWTHEGEWRYAYDFVIRQEGSTFKNEGLGLEDYHAYRKPVLSPVSGYVIDLKKSIEDNAIGQVNTIENWGNYVVIQTALGSFVELSHFSRHSLRVRKGEFVEQGQMLGLCGNSGYSPQPHIHIQVQESAVLGSRTLPFNFVSYIRDDTLHFYERPLRDEDLESCVNDRILDKILSFSLDSVYSYKVYKDGKEVDAFALKVKMNRFSGQFYFEDEHKNLLYFAKEAGMFYFYDYEGDSEVWLQKFYTAMPRVPLCYKKDLRWRDYLPVHNQSKDGWFDIYSLGAIFVPKILVCEGEWRFEDGLNLKGRLSKQPTSQMHVELDQINGIKTVRLEGWTIRMEK